MPDWAEVLVEFVFACCTCKEEGRTSGFSVRCSELSEDSWDVKVAPEPVELSGGPNDGRTVFDPLDVNLRALSGALDTVEEFYFDPGIRGAPPHILLGGKLREREVFIHVLLVPFPDEEARTVFDVNSRDWRRKRQ
jgi:hypothetical protein